MTDEEKRRFLQLLVLRAIRSVRSGGAVKLKARGKKMKVNFDLGKLKKAFVMKPHQIQRILDEIVTDVQKRCPTDTTLLLRSISSKITGTNKGEVYIKEKTYPGGYGTTTNEVAKYQHFGTDRHFIKPRKKGGVLAWNTKTSQGFSRGHEVMGVTATKWFEPSKIALIKIQKLMQTYIKVNTLG